MSTKKKKVIVKKSVSKKRKVTKGIKTSKPTITKKVSEKNLKIDKQPPLILTEDDQKYLQQHQTLKLQIELVPGSCWWSNVRSHLTSSKWDKIRIPVYQKANNLCEICGGTGIKYKVVCHEVWVYDDMTLTQRLSHFQALCPLCHEVKHIGLAEIRGYGEIAFNRFKTINQLDETLARQIERAVLKQWRIRSSQQWKLDIEHVREYGFNPEELKDKQERRK